MAIVIEDDVVWSYELEGLPPHDCTAQDDRHCCDPFHTFETGIAPSYGTINREAYDRLLRMWGQVSLADTIETVFFALTGHRVLRRGEDE